MAILFDEINTPVFKKEYADAPGPFDVIPRGIAKTAQDIASAYLEGTKPQAPDHLKRRPVNSVDPTSWGMEEHLRNTPMGQIVNEGFTPTNFPMEDTIAPEVRENWMGSQGKERLENVPQAQHAVNTAKAVVEPGIVAPDPGMDPVGHLAAKNANISEGKGNLYGMVEPAPDTTLTDTREAVFKDMGQEMVMETQEDLEPWYKSGTFYRGLVSFGLNLLAGNDIGAAFNNAGQYYDSERGRELREMWRDDLLAKGYDMTEIQEYIDTGKDDVLTDPMEKAQQYQQYQLGQYALGKAQREEQYAPEDRAWEIEDRQIKRDEAKENREFKRAQRSEQQQLASLRAKVLEGKLAGGQAGQAGQDDPSYGDFDQPLSKETSDTRRWSNLWNRARGQAISYFDEFGTGSGADIDLIDEMIRDAGVSESTKLDDGTWNRMLSKLNPEQRSQIEKQMAVVVPILRGDSGAAISAQEYRTALNTYFGRRGDSEKNLNSKEKELVAAIEGMNPRMSAAFRTAMVKRHVLDRLSYDTDGSIWAIGKDGTGKRYE